MCLAPMTLSTKSGHVQACRLVHGLYMANLTKCFDMVNCQFHVGTFRCEVCGNKMDRTSYHMAGCCHANGIRKVNCVQISSRLDQEDAYTVQEEGFTPILDIGGNQLRKDGCHDGRE